MENMTRKGFVAGAIAAGLAVTATAMTPAMQADATEKKTADAKASSSDAQDLDPNQAAIERNADWLGEEPVFTEDQITETIETDVLVIGAGVSGVAATRAAVEAGASVVILEKGESYSGRGEDYTVIGGEVQKRYGRADIDPDAIVDEVMKECDCRNKRDILSTWAHNCGEAFDWLLESCPDLYICDKTRADVPDDHADFFVTPHRYPDPEFYDWHTEQYPIFPVTMYFQPGQAPIVGHNLEMAKSEGDVTTLFGTFAQKLEKDDDGRVIGAIFTYQDGRVGRVRASRGVILATGDYGSNQQMLQHFVPQVVENKIHAFYNSKDVNGNNVNTGDGHKMAVWAGARLQQNHAPMIHHMGTPGVMGIAPFLLLNRDGKRFCNEDLPGQQLENQIEQQPEQYAWQIFDAKWPEELAHMPAGHGVACYYSNDEPKNNTNNRNYVSDAKLAKSVEDGNTLKADTLEELLAQMDVDTDAALASIERYNELAKAGKDEDFNKKAERVFALETGPFYACRFGTAAMLVCIGGVESDPACHAYDNSWNLIPGLYVTGNMQGGRFAVEYPICCPGISHSMALTFGRIAGTNCAQGL
ncbi:MAG: FAD-dependent oxidoreductase [Coriobacteriales bacterium]|jgi:fumarate reductase flavoprotein subunit